MFRSAYLASACLLVGVVSMAAAPDSAHAAKFGTDEAVHVLAPTGIVHNGKSVSICYKTMTYYFLAGVYTTDEHVLCEGPPSQRYWPIPTGETLAKLQRDGLMPATLPHYERGMFDYVIGYSLWLFIAAIAIYLPFSMRSDKAKKSKALDVLKLGVRRVMAHTAVASNVNAEHSRALAFRTYEAIFKESLQDSDFDADIAWVRQDPTALDGYLGAIGRNLDNQSKVILLQAAVQVAMADGGMDAGEQDALRHIAQRLGMKPKDAENFLSRLGAPPPPSQPSLSI